MSGRQASICGKLNANMVEGNKKKEYMSTVSIIIPTYKRAEHLPRAIESCINQTYKDIEILVIDDNEPDSEYAISTKNIVTSYGGVRYIKNERNLGGAQSRNEGIKAAKGDFIAFLDDDDEFLPTKIEEQIKYYRDIQNDKCCMVYCYYNLISDSGEKKTVIRDVEGNNIYEHLMNNIAMTSTWFCPRQILLDEGGFEDVKCCQEGTLLLKLLERGYCVYRAPQILMNMYVHRIDDASGITNISSTYIESAKEYEKRCLHAADRLPKNEKKAVYLIKYYWIYNLYYILKDRKGKKEYLKKMLKVGGCCILTLKAFCKYFLNNSDE